MPEGAIYVGRPTKWGNPFVPGRVVSWNRAGWLMRVTGTPDGRYGERCIQDVSDAVETYRQFMAVRADRTDFFEPLRGKDLACWCPLDQPCHADVLLELANAAHGKDGR